jgi:hypothetical protein
VQKAPSNESLLVVQLGEVLKPGVDYSIGASGSQITFSAGKAPAASNTWVLFQGQSLLNASTSAVEVDTFTGDGVDDTFVVTSPPYSQDNLAVFVDGLLQSYTTNWTLSGSTITFTAAPDNLSKIDVFHFKIVSVGTWVEVPNTANPFNALSGGKYLIDAAASHDVNLPAAPALGDEVVVTNIDPANSIDVISSDNINNSAADYTVTALTSVRFVYAGSFGWAVTA